jgi:hypothetical protein
MIVFPSSSVALGRDLRSVNDGALFSLQAQERLFLAGAKAGS